MLEKVKNNFWLKNKLKIAVRNVFQGNMKIDEAVRYFDWKQSILGNLGTFASENGQVVRTKYEWIIFQTRVYVKYS